MTAHVEGIHWRAGGERAFGPFAAGMPRRIRTCARARWLARLAVLLALAACGPSRHTVGQLKGEPAARGSGGPAADPSGEQSDAERDPAASGDRAQQPANGIGNGSAGGGSIDEPDSDPGDLPHAGQGASLPPVWDGGSSGCLSAVLPAPRKRLDLYLVVDINITLPLTGAWSIMTGGLLEYVADERAAGTGVGVDFFGVLPPVTGSDCEAASFAEPAVAVAELPGNAAAIRSSVRRLIPLQGSPMLPALAGALEYTRERAGTIASEAEQAVVLITDGFVDLACGSDVRSVSQVAGAEMRRYPAVPTYVIALDVPSLTDLLDPLQRFEPLDAIAREGGTTRARRIDIEAPASALAESLLDIQRDAEPCAYAIPEELSGAPDALRLELLQGGAGESAVAFERVATSADCGEGYYFDDARTEAWLCPDSCEQVKARAGASLTWSTLCP